MTLVIFVTKAFVTNMEKFDRQVSKAHNFSFGGKATFTLYLSPTNLQVIYPVNLLKIYPLLLNVSEPSFLSIICPKCDGNVVGKFHIYYDNIGNHRLACSKCHALSM
jgi:hypothetical protein